MKKKIYSIRIQAVPEKVWKVLWDDSLYRKWTAVFCEGSYVETDWKEGSKALFLDGKGQGMVSRIARKKSYEVMDIEHIGVVSGGKEITEGKEVEKWAGAHETYFLERRGNDTELRVEIDITSEYEDYFEKTWPQALQRVKEMAEGDGGN